LQEAARHALYPSGKGYRVQLPADIFAVTRTGFRAGWTLGKTWGSGEGGITAAGAFALRCGKNRIWPGPAWAKAPHPAKALPERFCLRMSPAA